MTIESFEGIITIDDAIKALKEKTILKEALKQGLFFC